MSQVDRFFPFSFHVFIPTTVEPSKAVGVNSVDEATDRISLQKLSSGGAF